MRLDNYAYNEMHLNILFKEVNVWSQDIPEEVQYLQEQK